MQLLVLVMLGLGGCQGRSHLLGRPHGGFLRPLHEAEAVGAGPLDSSQYTIGWFDQTLDHFNPIDGRTFKQQYIVNSNFYKPGGPLFVQIGGEGAIGPGFSVRGNWVENGAAQGALMFQLEHRYYGQTHPTPDASTGNLQYLSSEQALADTAQFILAMKAQFGMGSAKVLVFGGSYSGAMAAWFRLKYPHIADGAVGSSGPVWAKADFFEYLEVVGRSVDTINPGCSAAITTAFQGLTSMLAAKSYTQINAMFNLCPALTATNAADPMMIQSLYGALIEIFQTPVQYNGQGPHYQVLPICLAMRNATLGTPVQRLAALAHPETGCYGYDYHADIQMLQQTAWNDTWVNGGTRQWIWQTCTEFGYYQTTDSSDQPFGTHVPLSFYEQVYCNRVFGTSNLSIAKGIASSLNIFGGRQLTATNVVLPNGSIDPWHALGILSSPNPTCPAIFIQGGSHCQNMGSARPTDSPAMKAAKKQIAKYISVMLHGY